jgi:hypothetical protein
MKKICLLILIIAIAASVLCSCDSIPDFVNDILVNDKDDNSHVHKWLEATCVLPSTCECGETKGEPLGHDASAASCVNGSICNRCGENVAPALGHNMNPATCYEAATCDVCGYKDGEPLEHNMTEATCQTPSYCMLCEHTDTLFDSHDLIYEYDDFGFRYYCKNCNKILTLENYYYLDGEDHDGMTWNATNAKDFFTLDSSGKPAIVNGYYEIINNTGNLGQLQIWVPASEAIMSGFSKETESVGMFSFKLDAFITNNFNMKICDTSSSGNRWSEEWCIVDPFFRVMPAKMVNESSIVYIYGCDELLLGEIAVNDYDYFTGWIDVKIGIVLDSHTSTITFHYYINGDYKGWATKELTTSTGAVNSVYINGNTSLVGSGIRLDDVVFGYDTYGNWEFDTHVHEVLEGSCTSIKGCTVCETKSSGGDSFGHTGGEGSCERLPICEVCGEPYGGYNHDMSEASCIAPPTCSLCGFKEGKKTSHTLAYSYSDSGLAYSCIVCQKTFTVQNGAYLDGSGYDNMVGILNRDNFTTADGTQLPVLEDGVYKLINTSGKNAQLQLWIPSNNAEGAGVTEGFTSNNYPAGFISFRFNSYMTSTIFRMQFIDHSTGADRWSEEWCIKDAFFKVTSVTSDDQMKVDLLGYENVLLKRVTIDPETKFTGWIDVVIGIVLDPITDQLTLHYYVDGSYVTTKSVALTTSSNGINSVYVTGSTDVIGSGVMLDDIAFGYTAMSSWVFDNCSHEWRNATCTTAKYCLQCNKTVGSPLGHNGGTATCTELAVCTKCKKTYGEYAPHDISDDGVCVECGYKDEQ